MKVIFSNEIIASDFFNEITNNYTEDILDPYHGRIDWYLTNFYEKPVSEFEVDKYDTKYYNKDLYSWRNESVINIAEMFYAFNELADNGDSKYIKIIWEDDTITFEAIHKELKKYEEIVYNTFLPFMLINIYLKLTRKINHELKIYYFKWRYYY